MKKIEKIYDFLQYVFMFEAIVVFIYAATVAYDVIKTSY
jgi:hypothetical protein